MDIKLLTPDEAKKNGFGQFNSGTHICVDLPDGKHTISVRTSEGRLITFAFCPFGDNTPPQCVDIQHHTSGKTASNGASDFPVQQVTCWTPGQPVFVGKYDDPKPISLVVVNLQPAK